MFLLWMLEILCTFYEGEGKGRALIFHVTAAAAWSVKGSNQYWLKFCPPKNQNPALLEVALLDRFLLVTFDLGGA